MPERDGAVEVGPPGSAAVQARLVPAHRLPAAPDAVTAGRSGQIVGSHDGHGIRVAVACARFNCQVTERLLQGAEEAMVRLGVSTDEPVRPPVCWVPGAFELPLAARALLQGEEADAVVALGCVIRGETSHYEFVAGQCAAGLQRVQLDTGSPVVFGVLTTETLEQALERSGGALGNKGTEAVETAVEMVNLLAALRARDSASSAGDGRFRGAGDLPGTTA